MNDKQKVGRDLRRNPFISLILAFTLIIGATAVIHEIRIRSIKVSDYVTSSSGTDTLIDIKKGDSGLQIARILYQRGVVASSEAFFRLAVSDVRSAGIAPGIHRVQLKISAQDALIQLLDASRIPGLVVVKEGAWRSEIFAELSKAGFDSKSLLSAANNVKLPQGFSGTEGLFFPAQYSFVKGTSALQALQEMVDRFSSEVVSNGLVQGRDGFTPMQLLTIASIIQAEGDAGDFPKISQVIRNRLKKGMPLQLDTTVHFIKHSRGQIFLDLASTKLSSPYNTYLHYGLPPGPIGTPGKAAMEASMQPMSGDWIFFITVKPGDTRFTASINEFNQWKSEYEKNYRAGLFGKKP